MTRRHGLRAFFALLLLLGAFAPRPAAALSLTQQMNACYAALAAAIDARDDGRYGVKQDTTKCYSVPYGSSRPNAGYVYSNGEYVMWFDAGHSSYGNVLASWAGWSGYFDSKCTAPEVYTITDQGPPKVGACVDPNKACQDARAAASDPSSPAYNPASNMQTVVGATSSCVGGCTYSMEGPTIVTQFGSTTWTYGHMAFSGQACAATPDSPPPAKTPPKPDQPQCVPTGDGQTMCVKQDGKHCYTASTGRMICWNPGETGTKTDGSVAQKRDPGPTPGPPPPPPNGESMNQTGTPTTSTTIINNTTTTTTTTNYSTNYGTNAGSGNQGESDGSGSSPPATDSGDTSNNHQASGGNCSRSYTCSGDPILCAQLEESRKLACALTDTSGSDPARPTLKADTQAGTGADAYADSTAATSGLLAQINAGGFGFGTACPVLPAVSFMGHEVEMPTSLLCNALAILAGFILLGGWIQAAYIIGKG